MSIATPRLGGQTITFTIKQQQRVITGRREVPFVGTLLLLAMDWDLGAIQVEQVVLAEKRNRPRWLPVSAAN